MAISSLHPYLKSELKTSIFLHLTFWKIKKKKKKRERENVYHLYLLLAFSQRFEEEREPALLFSQDQSKRFPSFDYFTKRFQSSADQWRLDRRVGSTRDPRGSILGPMISSALTTTTPTRTLLMVLTPILPSVLPTPTR